MLRVFRKDTPPREVERAELVQAFGLEWLEVTVLVQASISKRTGEVRYRPKSTRYRVERPDLAGVVNLVRDTGEVYEVTARSCTCEDATFRGKARRCKYVEACTMVELLVVR